MSESTRILAELVREKRRVLTQLHQLGERQGELVAQSDVASLLKLLSAKQRLLVGVKSLEDRLAPYRSEAPDDRVWATSQHRAACAADADECRRLLAAIVEMERSHEQIMTQRRDLLADQLQKTHIAHDASDAYRTHRRPVAPAPIQSPTNSAGMDAGGLDITSEV
ncbi:MAG: hypothetical protein AAF589_00350 [Planctomycetota bacterium]